MSTEQFWAKYAGEANTSVPDVKKDRQQYCRMDSPSDFQIIQDLITDLVFDPWDQDKAYELKAILMDLELSQELTGLEHPTPIVMERLDRLSRLRRNADRLPGDTGDIYDLVAIGYQRLLNMVTRCFRITPRP